MMFAEDIQGSIRKVLRSWWAEHQDASLEALTQNAESLWDLQEHEIQVQKISDTEDEVQPRGRTYRERRPRKNRVLSLDKPSQIPRHR